MEKIDLNVISEFFENDKQLNLGKYPNIIIMEYGYTFIDNEFVLYLKGENGNNDFIKDFIGTNNEAHFYKFARNGRHIIGNGTVKILETEEEKINGLKIIIKQQIGNNNGLTFDENEVNNLEIVTILVENYSIVN